MKSNVFLAHSSHYLILFSFSVEIFYENGGLEAFISLFNDEACPDHQHVLQTILTLSSAKPNALPTLAERNQTLIEQFQQKLNERRQGIQSPEEQQVRFELIAEFLSIEFPFF